MALTDSTFPSPDADTHGRAGAWALVVALSLAVAWPFVAMPFPSFYKEWVFAAGLGFALILLGPFQGRARLLRHPLAWAAAGILAALAVQGLVRPEFGDVAALQALYAVFFLASLAAGQRLRQLSPTWPSWLVRGMGIAATGTALLALLQLAGVPWSWVMQRDADSDRLYANLAQANHFAAVSWLGAIATAIGWSHGRIRTPVAIGLVLLLLLTSAWSGSRMVWLFGAGLLGLAVLFRVGRRAQSGSLPAALAAIGVVGVSLGPILDVSGVSRWVGATSTVERAFGAAADDSTNMRRWLLSVGADAVRKEPVLGVGPGGFAGHTREMAVGNANAPYKGAEINAHNVFVHLAAELGSPVAAWVALCLALWLVRCWRASRDDAMALPIVALAGIVWVHANLEYPLGYTYFLGLLGLIAGHLTGGSPQPASGERADRNSPAPLHAIGGFAVLLGAVFCYTQFRPLERAMHEIVTMVAKGAPPHRSEALVESLRRVPRWSPFHGHANGILAMTAAAGPDDASVEAARCDRAVRELPAPFVLARCATTYAAAGAQARALEMVDGLCRIFPGSVPQLETSVAFVRQVSPVVGGLAPACTLVGL